MNSIQVLYNALETPMQQAYKSYNLSCKAGCAQCCETSVGFHLCINPLEWQAMHKCLMAHNAIQKRAFFERATRTLWQHRNLLNEILDYFAIQPERLQDSEFHLEVSHIARAAEKTQCVFLDDNRCGIYTGRPFTCRVYGNSQVQNRHPFTCDKDWQTMETILLDENNQLLSSTLFREQLWDIHEKKNLTHKQVMNAWIFTHLDFTNRDFLPCRLDLEQFQSLNNEQILNERWAQLKSCL